jgi:hypothetical protein
MSSDGRTFHHQLSSNDARTAKQSQQSRPRPKLTVITRRKGRVLSNTKTVKVPATSIRRQAASDVQSAPDQQPSSLIQHDFPRSSSPYHGANSDDWPHGSDFQQDNSSAHPNVGDKHDLSSDDGHVGAAVTAKRIRVS